MDWQSVSRQGVDVMHGRPDTVSPRLSAEAAVGTSNPPEKTVVRCLLSSREFYSLARISFPLMQLISHTPLLWRNLIYSVL
jgi:hypothetical protein